MLLLLARMDRTSPASWSGRASAAVPDGIWSRLVFWNEVTLSPSTSVENSISPEVVRAGHRIVDITVDPGWLRSIDPPAAIGGLVARRPAVTS
jgi:hypothetical protein